MNFVVDSDGHMFGKFTDVNLWNMAITPAEIGEFQSRCGFSALGNVVSWDDLKEATFSGAMLSVPSTCDGTAYKAIYTVTFANVTSLKFQTAMSNNRFFLVVNQCSGSDQCNGQNCTDQEHGFVCVCSPGIENSFNGICMYMCMYLACYDIGC